MAKVKDKYSNTLVGFNKKSMIIKDRTDIDELYAFAVESNDQMILSMFEDVEDVGAEVERIKENVDNQFLEEIKVDLHKEKKSKKSKSIIHESEKDQSTNSTKSDSENTESDNTVGSEVG